MPVPGLDSPLQGLEAPRGLHAAGNLCGLRLLELSMLAKLCFKQGLRLHSMCEWSTVTALGIPMIVPRILMS